METNSSPFQYCDVFEEAGSPGKLSPYYVFEPVWPRESIERHTEMSRLLADQRGVYGQLESMPRELLDQATLRRLRNLVHHAFNNIPFYRDLYTKAGFEPGDFKSLADFERLPILKKEDVRALYEQIAANPKSEVRFMARTSGSTGVPLSLINDTDRQRHWFVTRLNMFERMMGLSIQPERWMYSIYYEPFMLSSIFGSYRTFTIGLNAETEALVEHIRQVRPQVITGVASHILRVAKQLSDAKSLGIELFTTNSETSSAGERREIERITGVPVLDEYSSEELGIIAFEEKNGSYLVAEDTVHVELTDLDHEASGSVIGTDLWNYVMPRIRYSQGDFAAWDQQSPATGLRRLKSLSGRQDMQLYSPSFGPIDAGRILEILDTTLVPMQSGVREFRIVQNSLQDLRLLVKLEPGATLENSALFNFKVRFEKLFGPDPKLQLQAVADLPVLGRKRRCIVRNFNV
jgi:phenylacetate-CoA ligase